MSSEAELAAIPIFSELSKKELKAVTKLMTAVDIKDGQVLIRQGSPGREFLILSEGTAKVDIDGRTVAHLSAGDFLGELSVISGAPRTATVTATSAGSMQVLNRREFMALLDKSSSLSRKVLVGAVKRLQENQTTTTH